MRRVRQHRSVAQPVTARPLGKAQRRIVFVMGVSLVFVGCDGGVCLIFYYLGGTVYFADKC